MPLSYDRHIIDSHFRKELENYSVRPYSRVWSRIAQSLSVKERKSEAKKILLITAGLLLIASSAGVYESFQRSEPIRQARLQTANLSPVNEAAESVGVTADITPGIPKEQAQSPAYPAQNRSSLIQFPLPEAPEQMSVTNENRSMSSLIKKERAGLPQISSPNPASPRLGKSSETHPGKYFVGITANLNNTWLVDKQAMASENMKYEFTLGGSYGLQGGFRLANRWGVQTAWLVNSWQGQNYENLDVYGRTTNLDYTQKSISLIYMNLPLLVQYRIPRYSNALKNSYEMSMLLGGQYGMLLSYTVNGVKGEISDNDLFKRSEFAVVAGFDYDLMTSNPVFYTVGLRASLGTNIFNEEVPNYFEFSKPHNFIIGLHGAVNFGFSK
jgi:hypothetical protein